MQYTSLSGKKAWTLFFAIWLLSSLILGVVHGAGIGIFFGLGIASGYLAAARLPALLAQRRQHSNVSVAGTRRSDLRPDARSHCSPIRR